MHAYQVISLKVRPGVFSKNNSSSTKGRDGGRERYLPQMPLAGSTIATVAAKK